jgi:hypothetical protein
VTHSSPGWDGCCCLLLAGLIYVGHHAREYFKWMCLPATLGLKSSSDFYGLTLTAQHGIGRHPWRYVAAIWPGVILTAIELVFDPPVAISLLMFTVGTAVVVFLVLVQCT